MFFWYLLLLLVVAAKMSSELGFSWTSSPLPSAPRCQALSSVIESRDPSVLGCWCWGSHAALSCSMHICGFVFFLCFVFTHSLSCLWLLISLGCGRPCSAAVHRVTDVSPEPAAAAAGFWHTHGTVAYTVCVLSRSSEKSLTVLHR